jgi:hypothetical protein
MTGTLKSWYKFVLSILALAFLSLTFSPALLAQSATTGAITGTVTDASGSVVPNATVTVTSADTGQGRTATTGSSGAYTVGFLPPGKYSIKFEAAGFGTATVPSVTINVTETPTVNQTLNVGSQTTMVEVTTQAELVQTTSAANGTVVDSKAVTDIPLTTRNYTNLMGLSAGVQATVFNAITLGRGSQDIEVNGAGPSQNNYSQDGASINSYAATNRVGDSGNNPGMAIVNPDAVAEFKIQTSMYDASYGRNPGANVNVVTKSGTNEYHGTAFEFFRNTVFNANDFFRPQNPAPNPTSRPVLNQNQFGGSFGGPIKKDKLFMFLSEQETRQINGAAAQGYSTPTLPAIPAGDRSTAAFKAALGAAFGPSGAAGCTSLASNGVTSVGGTQIACDGSNINPAALKILNLKNPDGTYYIPGSGSANGSPQQIAESQPVHFTEHQVIGNFDYTVTPKNTLSLRFFWSEDPARITMSCAGSGGGANATGSITGCLPGAPGLTNFPAMYDTLRLTTLVTNNLVNEARLSIQTIGAQPVQLIPFKNADVGIANIIPGEPDLDTIIIANGKPSLQFGAGNNLANLTKSGAWVAADSISWSHGKHTVRAGFEYERDRVNQTALKTSLGTLNYQTFQDFLLSLPGCPPGTSVLAGTCTQVSSGNGTVLAPQPAFGSAAQTNGTSLSNLLNTGTNGFAGPAGLQQNFRDNILDGFVQDDFKVSRSLTVNIGVRWEYDGWPIEINGKNTNTWFSNIGGAGNIPVGMTVNGVVGTLGNSLATGSLNAWVTASNYNPANYAAPPVPGVAQSPFPGVAQFPKDAFAPRFGVAWKPLSSDRLAVRAGFGVFYDRLGYSFIGRSSGAPPYSSVLGNSGTSNYAASLQTPYPAGPYSLGWPTTSIRWFDPTTGKGSAINTPGPVGPFLNVPTTNQYNLSVQYQFLTGWVLDLGYVGTYAYHLFPQSNFTEHEYNQANLIPAGSTLYGQTVNSVGNVNYRVPYLGFAAAGLFADETNTWSKYNSLQATVKKQLSHGLTFSAAYSFSKSISNSYYLNYDDSYIQHYGLNGFYRPQRIAINYNWALPIAKHEGLLGKAVNGWSVSGVTVIQSGDPLTLVDSRGGAAYGLPTNRVLATAILAPGMTRYNEASTLGGNVQNRIGCANTQIGSAGTGTCSGGGWFNRAAFDALAFQPFGVGKPGDGVGLVPNYDPATAATTPATGWGNSGYGTLLGPGQFNFDISIQKSTVVGGLRENATLQFRTDLFNAFNHPQFADPNVDLNTASFGQIGNTSVNPRLLQFSLKYIF